MTRDRVAGLAHSPPFWFGLAVLAALIGALFYSGGAVELGRASAAYQREVQVLFSTSLRDIGSGKDASAIWALLTVAFGYGVVHTLGPGHGKTLVAAYFLDGAVPQKRMAGIVAGGWVAITHTFSALALAAMLKLMSVAGLFGALAHARLIEALSYGLIVAVGAWRLRASLRGESTCCEAHDHAHHHHHHDHRHLHVIPTVQEHQGAKGSLPPRAGVLPARSGMLLLSAAGLAPCAGALILVLLSLALDVLWAGILGVLAIAAGMTIALAAVGMASMLANRLIVGASGSGQVGRVVSIGSSLVVIAAGGILLWGAVFRQMGWA